jgi:hypothetical protein
MSAVDRLLVFLMEDRRTVLDRMATAGYTEDQIREAWDQARAAGFTESTGLGQDRLTAALPAGLGRTSFVSFGPLRAAGL